MGIRRVILFIFFWITFAANSFCQNQSYYDSILKKEVFTKFDQRPVFQGGEFYYQKFIKDNLKYPKKAFENNIETVVLADLVIDTDGTILSTTIEKSIEKFGYQFGFEEEVLRLTSMMSKWNPAYVRSNPACVKISLPFYFIIKSEIDITFFDDLVRSGNVMLHNGNYLEASILFERAIADNPSNKKIIYYHGLARFFLHDTIQACKDWKKMLDEGDSSVFEIYSSTCDPNWMYKKILADSISKASELYAKKERRKAEIQDSIYSDTRADHREFFIQASVLIPVGVYGGSFIYDNNINSSASFKSNMEGSSGGFNSKPGYETEVGAYIFLKQLNSKNSAGIRLTLFSLTTNRFNWDDDDGFALKGATYKNVISFSFKIGPCIRKMFSQQYSIRFYYQISPTISNHAQWIYSHHSGGTDNEIRYSITDHAEFHSGSGFGIKHEFGAVYNFRSCMIGAAFNVGSIKYDNAEFKSERTEIVEQYSDLQHAFQVIKNVSFKTDNKFQTVAPTAFFLFSISYRFW